MKSLNIKKLAAIGIGAVLAGSAIAPIAAAELSLSRDQVFGADGSPKVSIVTGGDSAPSDGVWAGNIAAKIASMAFSEEDVKVSVAGAGGAALVPKLEDLSVDVTIGGVTTIFKGSTDDFRFVLDSNAITEIDEQEDASPDGTVQVTDSDLDFLRDETLTSRVGNTSRDITVQEIVEIAGDARFNDDSDVEDLQFILNTKGVNYRINLGTGLEALESPLGGGAGASDYTDDSASDKQEMFFFGQLYQVRTIDEGCDGGGTNCTGFIDLIREGAEKIYREGDEITGLVGKGKYQGQEMKIVVKQGFSRTGTTGSATNVIELALYDAEGNLVDQDQFAPADDESVFEDENGDEVMESPLFIQEVNKRTDAGFVETFTATVLLGKDRIELREGRGFPFDEDDTDGIYDFDVDLIFSGDTACNSAATTQGSGCSPDRNRLIEVQVFNDNLTFNTDDAYLRATGRAGGSFAALNPNNGFDSVSLKDGEGNTFLTVEAGGFEFDTMNTLKIGRGANDDTGYIQFQDDSQRFHKVPMEIRNLVTATDFGDVRVISFDEGAQQYNYVFNTSDQNFAIGDNNVLNGVTVRVMVGAPCANVGAPCANTSIDANVGITQSAEGNWSGDFWYLGGGDDTNCGTTTVVAGKIDRQNLCRIGGVNYTYDGPDDANTANDGNTVRLRTAGALRIRTGSSVSSTTFPVPFDTALNNAIYLDGNNIYQDAAIRLTGNGDTVIRYMPLLTETGSTRNAFLVLSAQTFTLEDSARLDFNGTSLNAATTGTEDEDVADVQDVNYFAIDKKTFGAFGFDETDSSFNTALFHIQERVGGTGAGDLNIFVDTRDGRLVDAGNDQISAPKFQVRYRARTNTVTFDLRFDQPETSLAKGYTDFGSKVETDGSLFTMTYPENVTEFVGFVYGAGKLEVKETGGTTINLVEGQSYTTNEGTKLTVSKINVGSATCEGAEAGAATCSATPSKVTSPAGVRTPIVYLDSDAPAGTNIIVGGPLVNKLAAEVAGLADRLTAPGQYVAEVDPTTGDVVVAGYNGMDTGKAAQELINALDRLA